jgi:hypothetical protein
VIGGIVEAAQDNSKGLGERVERMDMELKAFFTEQRLFIGEPLDGVEKRLGARIDKVERRLDKIDVKMSKMDKTLAQINTTLKKLSANRRPAD